MLADSTSVVEFVSSDDEVFTATKVSNAKVTLTGVSAGEGTLTATTDTGKSATLSVTVTEPVDPNA